MKILQNKVLLITGGTGSFGSSVLAKFIDSDISEIRIFSRDEKKQEDLRKKFNSSKLKFILGDASLMDGFLGVDLVFHAAALKQVPSCEFYPLEAVKTNVLGTDNVITAAIQNNIEKVVVLSTDKAVYPINAMGISKAMSEKIVIARSRFLSEQGPILSCTRYGNVMGSRGSVIPLFIEQFRLDKNITITDPNMTRFLMSLDESVDLVMHAFEHSNQGDIFVQKSPAATIKDLFDAVSKLLNQTKDPKYIGTRHGEKLYESLISREEMSRAEDMENYFRIPADTRDLNYDKYFTDGSVEIEYFEDYTSHNTNKLSVDEIVTLIQNQSFYKADNL
jgi:UDP-N-acetylglucosamine 4,6-dehydratase/5-epimerase